MKGMFPMQLMIRSLSEKLPETIRETIDRQFQFALSRFEARIDSVQLTLRDNNGPRGGVDQECRAVVHMHDGTDIAVTEVQSSIMAAVAKLADRVAYAVTRRLDRKRDFSRVRTA
jgi:putative sigma-54 modulation protein